MLCCFTSKHEVKNSWQSGEYQMLLCLLICRADLQKSSHSGVFLWVILSVQKIFALGQLWSIMFSVFIVSWVSDLPSVPLTRGVGAQWLHHWDVWCLGIAAPCPLKPLAAALVPTASSEGLGPGRGSFQGGRSRLINATAELLNSPCSRWDRYVVECPPLWRQALLLICVA